MSAYTLRARERSVLSRQTLAALAGQQRAYDSDEEAGGLAALHAAPPTAEARAASGVGLDAAYPSRAERRAFPQQMGRRSGEVEYLSVRCVLRRWELQCLLRWEESEGDSAALAVLTAPCAQEQAAARVGG